MELIMANNDAKYINDLLEKTLEVILWTKSQNNFLPEMEFSAIAVVNVLTNHASVCFSPTFSWKNNEQQLRTINNEM
jgi:hypothetical protein